MSSENVSSASPKPQLDQIADAGAELNSSTDTAFNQLSADYERLKQRLDHERFIYILTIVIVTDISVWIHVGTWSTPVVCFALELVLLIVMAKIFRIPEVESVVNQALYSWRGKAKETREVDEASASEP